MNTYDFVHLALLALDGEIRGKTKLQKTVYFLGVLTNSVDELGFHAHYYGPYSEEVADAIGRLTALGFVDQNIAGGGAVNEFGFEVARYDYRLNDDGRAIAQHKAKQHPEEMQSLCDAASKLKLAGERNYVELSIAAKTYFMLGRKDHATMDELVRQARRFGWTVSEEEVRGAGQYLQRLGLVTVKEAK